MKKQNVRTVVLVVATLTYLLIGAAIFEAFEAQFETAERETLIDDQVRFMDKYNVSERDFRRLTMIVMHSVPHKAGIQWKFAGSFFFSTTVITTIGYGHSTPKTVGGKVFCMFYALVGIPLNLVMFQSIGERLNIFVTFVLRRLRSTLLLRRRVAATGSGGPHRAGGGGSGRGRVGGSGRGAPAGSAGAGASSRDVSQTHLIFISMNMSSLAVFGGAWAFSHYEDWTYLDSFYYCVITLTTVGFGDFVALQKNRVLQTKPHYVAFSILFILFGLAIVSAAMNLLVLRFLTMKTGHDRRHHGPGGDPRPAAATTNFRPLGCLNGDVITVSGSLPSIRGQGDLLCADETTLLSCVRGQPTTNQKPRYRVTRPPVAHVTHLLPLERIDQKSPGPTDKDSLRKEPKLYENSRPMLAWAKSNSSKRNSL